MKVDINSNCSEGDFLEFENCGEHVIARMTVNGKENMIQISLPDLLITSKAMEMVINETTR